MKRKLCYFNVPLVLIPKIIVSIIKDMIDYVIK